MQAILDINVVYGSERSQEPADRILELNNQSDNINDQFGGSYVWLVPVFDPTAPGSTSNTQAAITGFDIAIQKDEVPTLKNLAKDAGGDFRHLLLTRSLMPAEKVTDVVLLRLGSEMTDRPPKWDGNTSNINEGRGGPYLYLLWKTA